MPVDGAAGGGWEKEAGFLQKNRQTRNVRRFITRGVSA